MKISIIGPVYPYRGGIAHYNTLLIKSLQEHQIEVDAVSFRRQYLNFLYPGQTDKDRSKDFIQVPATYLLDPIYPWTWLQTAAHVIKEKPEFVLFQWWTTFWAIPFAIIANRIARKKIKVFFQIHNVFPHEERFLDRWLSQIALQNGQQFIVHTEKEAKRLGQVVPQANYHLIPLPSNSFFNDSNITKKEAREKLNIPAGEMIILTFGIVRPYKGVRYLIEAVEVLKRQGTSVHLVIAGEFWESESDYRSLIKQKNIQDQVHIFNSYIPNEEVPVFFKAADVFAAPYTGGTQSAAVKTALNFGLPIILTKVILDDILAKQANVWVAEPENAESLAVEIQKAMNSEEKTRPIPPTNDWDGFVQLLVSL